MSGVRYTLVLAAPRNCPDPLRRLRAALKHLWRSHNLRCVSIIQDPPNTNSKGASDDAQHPPGGGGIESLGLSVSTDPPPDENYRTGLQPIIRARSAGAITPR